VRVLLLYITMSKKTRGMLERSTCFTVLRYRKNDTSLLNMVEACDVTITCKFVLEWHELNHV